ncbi:MAG: 4-hydroxy-3-methylbut-2-enyl diphosphate reductase [Candidatus Omnitrophica bacterium]|nr:4-hydroxy-3-methylbut-2-enyl diphosphate reductase [Candidatus Omnitrophota bacterium]MCM8816062.1 4-hydroxy-3-methylbut-2-enyl diphosphate reductase [Candidatus Omnitrophota bacterium]
MSKEIIIGNSIGFCFGVTKAVSLAKKVLKEKKLLTSLGDLVHNPLVMAQLKEEGLRVIRDISQARKCPFIIRSHGLPPDVLEELKKYTDEIYDATCPFVRKVQNLVKKLSEEKNFIFLVGDTQHPEIIAMKKIAGDNCIIIDPIKKKDFKIPGLKNWAIVAQTTISLDLYKTTIMKILEKMKAEKITIYNTVCPVSITRQNEAHSLAGKVDALIVVGGKKSSNTTKLFLIGKRVNKNTYLVETPEEIKNLKLEKFKKIGIISGASTDVDCIRKIIKFLKTIQRKKNTRR